MNFKCSCSLLLCKLDPSCDFFSIRAQCDALKLVIPDSFVEEYQNILSKPLDEAKHISVPFLAYKSGVLENFTRPIHFLLNKSSILQRPISNQYIKDLQETWLIPNLAIDKYEKAKRFMSRILELCVALKLEENSMLISELEALGSNYDIMVIDQDQNKIAIEVKFIGEEKSIFELHLTAIRKGHAVGAPDAYSPFDYLLFRIYEGCHKLRHYNGNKIIAVILYDYDLSYACGLNNNFIDWSCPQLISQNKDITNMIAKKYKINPNIDFNFLDIISTIDEIQLYSIEASFDLTLRQKILAKTGQIVMANE